MKSRRPPKAPPATNPANEASKPIGESWVVRWIVLFAVTAIAHWPALRGQFLWDDDQHVTRLELQPLDGLWRIWTDLGATQQYYPLLHSAFWVEHRLWGDATFGYHLTNVALHSVSALLVILIAEQLGLPGAWFAGFLFALHPICVESVAWITEQKNALSGVFYLAATWTYLRFDRTRQRSAYLLALFFFVLGLLSKSALAALPAILLVVLWWIRGRLEWRRDILPLVPWFAAAISFGLLTYYVEMVYLGARGNAFGRPLAERLLLAGRVPWFYAGKVLLPFGLIFSYPRWKIDPGAWQQYLFPAGLLAAAAAGAFLARRNRAPLAALLIFLGALFPVLGLLNVFYFRYSYVADHFQYFACLAILIPAAAALFRWMARPEQRTARNLVAVAVLAGLGGLTWAQSSRYTDVETLYRDILAHNPESWLAHNNLGLLLAAEPDGLAEAAKEYREAIRIAPDYPEAHFNLGAALVHSGEEDQRPEAIGEYRTALRLKPDYVEAHYNLANLLSATPGRLPEAIVEYRAALGLEPGLARAHANLGNALARTPGRLEDAIQEYRAALQVDPGLTMQRVNLASALAQMPGRVPEAIAECEAALRVDPTLAPAKELLEQLKSAQR